MVEKSGIYTVTGFYNCCWKNKNKNKKHNISLTKYIYKYVS